MSRIDRESLCIQKKSLTLLLVSSTNSDVIEIISSKSFFNANNSSFPGSPVSAASTWPNLGLTLVFKARWVVEKLLKSRLDISCNSQKRVKSSCSCEPGLTAVYNWPIDSRDPPFLNKTKHEYLYYNILIKYHLYNVHSGSEFEPGPRSFWHLYHH